ncbi:MAG: hypothetical protein ACM3S4_07355 [Burkholderiales bacterium]
MFDTAQPQAGEPANQPAIEDADQETGKESRSLSDGLGDGGEAAADEPFLTVRYNKEQKPLSYQEAIEYAQKGMNYDKLQGRLKEMAEKLSEYETGLRKDDSEEEKQALVDAQLESFMRRYPGVDPRKLPASVLDAWKQGVPLLEAYLEHQTLQLSARIKEMERAAAQAEVNRANAAASMGSAASSGSTRGKQLSEEAIRNMTPEELDKNHERIWAYLTKS